MEASDSTTQFTPASSCTVDIYLVFADYDSCPDDTDSSLTSCRYYHLGPPTSRLDCFPTGWQSGSGAFMSTSKCPFGYTEACTSTNAPETTATCCPNSYHCQGIGRDFTYMKTELCYRPFSAGEPLIYKTSTPGQDIQTTTTTENGGGVNAYGIEIRWRMSSSASSTILTTFSTSPNTISTSALDPTVTPISQPLSAGAGAGIGIGATAAAALVLVGVFLLWRRQRKDHGEKATVHDTPPLDVNLQPIDRISRYTGSDRSASARLAQLPAYYNTEWNETQHVSPPVELGPSQERGSMS